MWSWRKHQSLHLPVTISTSVSWAKKCTYINSRSETRRQDSTECIISEQNTYQWRIMKKICVMCAIQCLATAVVLTCDTLICGMCAIQRVATAAVLTSDTLICGKCAIQWLATANSSCTDMWQFDLCDMCNTVISNSSCTDKWYFGLCDVCNRVICNSRCTDKWHFDLWDVCHRVISNSRCTDMWHFDNKKLPQLAAPRYATKAETNFWIRVPTSNQPSTSILWESPYVLHPVAMLYR